MNINLAYARERGGCGLGESERQVLMSTRRLALCAVLVLANLLVAGLAQSPCPGIHVKILNIRNSIGAVACALFESPDGFPTEFLRSAANIMMIKIKDSQARCDFEDQLDANRLGIPTEGYGFSNDAKAVLSAPHSAPPASRTTDETSL